MARPRTRRIRKSAIILPLLAMTLASCSAGQTKESAIETVKELEGSDFMGSGSVGRFGVESAVVEGDCAAVRIIELPDLYEITIFLRWTDGAWKGTNIVTGHSSEIKQTADDCFRD